MYVYENKAGVLLVGYFFFFSLLFLYCGVTELFVDAKYWAWMEGRGREGGGGWGGVGGSKRQARSPETSAHRESMQPCATASGGRSRGLRRGGWGLDPGRRHRGPEFGQVQAKLLLHPGKGSRSQAVSTHVVMAGRRQL